MPLVDDGDIVRGLGFVTLYAAHVEQDVDDLLQIMDPITAFDEKTQRWNIKRKLKHAARIVRSLQCVQLNGLPQSLEDAIVLFERRNEYIHGRIWADFDRSDYIQSGRPHVPNKHVTYSELYALANELWRHRSHFLGPQFSRLPQAIERYTRRAS